MNQAALSAMFKPYVERLIIALCRHCQYDQTMVCWFFFSRAFYYYVVANVNHFWKYCYAYLHVIGPKSADGCWRFHSSNPSSITLPWLFHSVWTERWSVSLASTWYLVRLSASCRFKPLSEAVSRWIILKSLWNFSRVIIIEFFPSCQVHHSVLCLIMVCFIISF